MSTLGRRKHSRYLLAQPIEGTVRVRDEVMIESLDEHEIILLAGEACRPEERVSLEIPGGGRSRVHAKVVDSRPEVVEDGTIRHRIRLVPSSLGAVATPLMEKSR